jgi:uncharacterized protein YbaP (TraB family)
MSRSFVVAASGRRARALRFMTRHQPPWRPMNQLDRRRSDATIALRPGARNLVRGATTIVFAALLPIDATFAQGISSPAHTAPAAEHAVIAPVPQAPPPEEAAPSAAPAAEAPIEEVLVTGERPGPALWKVTHGDHVMWVLGEQKPLPAKMLWRSAEVESAIASSQEVILDGGDSVRARGFFHTMRVVKRFIGFRKLPDGQTLKDVLPPDLYKRFKALTVAFAEGDKDIERLRPIFAATSLNDRAVKHMGLSNAGVSLDIQQIAGKAGVKVNRLTFDAGDPLEIMDNVAKNSTVPCLEMTVAQLETGRDEMLRLANAWSVGDIETLRQLAPLQILSECPAALVNGKERAQSMLGQREQAWLDAAENALKTNQTTFALLPMRELFESDGRLAKLRARGYGIQEP